MPSRLTREGIDALARRFAAGEAVSSEEFLAACEMARELLRAEPSAELVRLAVLLVSSRGGAPLKSSQAEALGAAVLRAAQGALLENALRALDEARAALVLGRNWIEGLERIRLAGKIGPQVVALARSMTKTMYRHMTNASEALNFGLAGPMEPLDPAEPGYREIPPLAQIARKNPASDVESALEALRIARLGIVKLTRFIHNLGVSPAERIWDAALARQAATAAQDAAAHLAELAASPDKGRA